MSEVQAYETYSTLTLWASQMKVSILQPKDTKIEKDAHLTVLLVLDGVVALRAGPAKPLGGPGPQCTRILRITPTCSLKYKGIYNILKRP